MKTKRLRAEALKDAEEFRALFSADSYQKWEFAGSIRRGKPEVGDVEHVIIPKFINKPTGLFGGAGDVEIVNAVWEQLPGLIASGLLSRHQYETHLADGSTVMRERWGDNYRGVDYRGFNHEMFLANESNWGAIFLIRTGPAEFSEKVVTRIKQGGMYRQQNGQLIHVQSGDIVPVKDELSYLRIAGMDWCEPKDRH